MRVVKIYWYKRQVYHFGTTIKHGHLMRRHCNIIYTHVSHIFRAIQRPLVKWQWPILYLSSGYDLPKCNGTWNTNDYLSVIRWYYNDIIRRCYNKGNWRLLGNRHVKPLWFAVNPQIMSSIIPNNVIRCFQYDITWWFAKMHWIWFFISHQVSLQWNRQTMLK